MSSVEFRVRHGHQTSAVEPGHRAGDAAGRTDRDVDVDRAGLRRAVLPGRRRQRGGTRRDLLGLTPTEATRRQRAAPPFGLLSLRRGHTAQHVVEHAVADLPLLQRVDLDGHGVLDRVDVPGQRDVQCAEEPFHRVLEEPDQFVEGDVVGGRRGQRRAEQMRAGCAVPGRDPSRGQHGRIEGERLLRCRAQSARRDVVDVEGLQRVFDVNGVAHRGRGGDVERVEQFHHRNSGWSALAADLVGTGIGDHQLLGGRSDRVQQQLPVLGTRIAFPGHRLTGQDVVSVHHTDAGKTPSSRPIRQTTRWGTDRIGTIVHTVKVPVRKLARVGRPAR